jgi:Holliday junction resolvase RusA-like endonuclease
MILKFTVGGDPIGKARQRFDCRTNRAYTPAKTRDYEELVRRNYRAKHGKTALSGAIFAAITAYFPIPKSWSKKRKEQAMRGKIKPTTKPDCDNIAKIMLDALNGAAYKDDAQITRLTVSKAYSLEARVEVVLQEINQNQEVKESK